MTRPRNLGDMARRLKDRATLDRLGKARYAARDAFGRFGVRETMTTEARFWAKVAMIPEHPCWEWIGKRLPSGYGHFHIRNPEKGTALAHRFSYELARGPIPDGLTIDHLCRNPSCVNPAHLEAVTMRENVLRGNGLTAIHARKTHCIHGHEFTPENTYRTTKGRMCRTCHRDIERRRRGVA